MRYFIAIFTFLLLISPSSATERVNLEGVVVEHGRFPEHNIKTRSTRIGDKVYGTDTLRIITVPAHFYIILKSSSLTVDARKQLTLDAKSWTLSGPLNPLWNRELKRDEMIVLIPVVELENLEKGAKVDLKGYSLDHFTKGLARTLDNLAIDGKKVKIQAEN